MRMNKAIKRIVALGTGVTMVGATILGAMAAADLNAYPSPFVSNGAFNALIVVGSQAKTEDVLGSIDIATSLQYATKVTKAIPGAASSATVTGEGVKIEGTNNKLNIGENLVAVKSKIDSGDLPTLLADGVYVADGDDESKSSAYTQKLAFVNGAVNFVKSTEYKDDQNPYMVLYDTAGADFMTYTLDFTKEPVSDYSAAECTTAGVLCDFEGTKIDILGVNYEVTDAAWDADALTWEMMGGTSLNTMYEGETKTFTVDGKDYEVTVDIISTDATVVLTVNGVSTDELSKDQTDNVAGIEIGIKKIMENEAGEEGAGKDLVQFYLGANKVEFSQADVDAADNVVVANEDVDDLTVDWTVSDDAAGDELTLQTLVLTWTPEDEIMLAKDEAVTFPLGNYRVDFAGLTETPDSEVISFTPDGDDVIEMSAPLVGGDLTIGLLFWDGAKFVQGDTATEGEGVIYTAVDTVRKGDYIILSDDDEFETRIVKFKDINSDELVTFEDAASGEKFEKSCSGLDAGTDCTMTIGESTIVLDDATLTVPKSVVIKTAVDMQPLIYTAEGLQIEWATADVGVTYDFTFTEEDENDGIGDGLTFTAVAEESGTADEVTIGTVADGTSDLSTGYELGDTEKYVYMSDFGTKITNDQSDNQESITIDYPGQEVYGQVFVNSLTAQVVDGGEGGATYDEVQRIDVGAAVLDTEVANIAAQNVIVVGGPCVNTLAAQLMGNPADCTAGFEDGKAMIKLFDQTGGKVAMLVAGYSAMDTRRASRVVANYDSYSNFEGTELEVTGTTLSDITVSAPVTE